MKGNMLFATLAGCLVSLVCACGLFKAVRCGAQGAKVEHGVPRRQPHRRSGLATLPSVGAVP